MLDTLQGMDGINETILLNSAAFIPAASPSSSSSDGEGRAGGEQRGSPDKGWSYKYLSSRVRTPDASEVIGGDAPAGTAIFIGNMVIAADILWLQQNRIGVVINAAGEEKHSLGCRLVIDDDAAAEHDDNYAVTGKCSGLSASGDPPADVEDAAPAKQANGIRVIDSGEASGSSKASYVEDATFSDSSKASDRVVEWISRNFVGTDAGVRAKVDGFLELYRKSTEEFYNTLVARSVRYLELPAKDNKSYDICKHAEEVCDFVRKASESSNKNILVHCQNGMNRSAAIVVMLLATFRGLSVHDSIGVLSKCRPLVLYGNQQFIRGLLEWEKEKK